MKPIIAMYAFLGLFAPSLMAKEGLSSFSQIKAYIETARENPLPQFDPPAIEFENGYYRLNESSFDPKLPVRVLRKRIVPNIAQNILSAPASDSSNSQSQQNEDVEEQKDANSSEPSSGTKSAVVSGLLNLGQNGSGGRSPAIKGNSGKSNGGVGPRVESSSTSRVNDEGSSNESVSENNGDNVASGGSSGGGVSISTNSGSGSEPGISPPSVNEVVVGDSAGLTSVTTSTTVTDENDHLYLVAVTHLNSLISVTGISGLGLSWTHESSQCGSNNGLNVDVWYAIGNPTGATTVTANFSGSVDRAQIIVLRLSNIDVASPLGTITSANLHGTDGAAHCGTPNTNQGGFSYPVNFTQSDSLAITFSGHNKNGNTFTPGEGTELSDDSVGGMGNFINFASKSFEVSTSGIQNMTGNYSISAVWSSITIEVKPNP